jgi:hypothetical protein
MSDASGWVLLVECHDVAELHALRAALEARGVPCQVQGEHTHGIMGAFQGAAVRSRVLVPAPALAVARTLVTDIVGPFDAEPAAAEDDTAEESPFRRPGERTPEVEAEAEESPTAPALRAKSYGRLLLVVLLVVGPFIGLGHVYAGLNTRAGALLLLTVFSLPAALSGAVWAQGALAGVWLADVVGGALGIAAHNRRVQAATASAAPPALAGE